MDQHRGRFVNVDLIRTVAMMGVILLHAAGRYTITSNQLSQMNQLDFVSWAFVDVYQSIAVPLSVPLFLMLSGALLLQPNKFDTLSAFFKKRWFRIVLPTIFWGCIYFVWVFLIKNIPFSLTVIVQGILNGPYEHFWYIYTIIGLYLLTPILRVFMTHANQALVKYFIVLWIIGVAILPFLSLFSVLELHSNVFTITGYVGFFILGAFLSTVRVQRSTVSLLMSLGIVLTAFGTYVLAATGADKGMYFFQLYLSPTIIFTSVMAFLFLLAIKPFNVNTVKSSYIHKLFKCISQNTLAIFFIHVIIIESIQLGYFGFTINRDVINPIVGVPLLAIITLFISLIIILILRKVPYLKKLIGAIDT